MAGKKTKIIKAAKFYSTFINPGDICYDVGANIGNKTASLIEIGAKVIAIEPQPACVAKIKKRFNNQVTVLETGLSDREGEIELHLTQTSTIASMNPEWIQSVQKQRFKQYHWNHKIKVPVTTLDKLILQYGKPKFIKIDVEGFELNILNGLHYAIKWICFEYVPEIIKIAIGCVDRLNFLDSNYEFNWSVGETMQFSLHKWVNANEMKNLLFQTKNSTLFGDVYARLKEHV